MRVIAGSARSVPLATKDGLETRPTSDRVKVAEFNIIQFLIEGRTVLDLFGGSGQLGIEALSRGAKEAVIVDADAQAVRIIHKNLLHTRLAERAKVVQSDFRSFLENCRNKFDLIFLDPPYASGFSEKAIKLISEIDILQSGGIILCEQSVDFPVNGLFPGIVRQKDYRYGKTILTVFRKEENT